MRFHSRPKSKTEYNRPTHSRGEPGFDPDSPRSLLEIADRIDALRSDSGPAAAWIRPPQSKPSHLMALSGTFNPVTTAHVGLIEAAMKHGARPAVFVIALRSVDKESLEVMSIEDRLALLDILSARIGASVAVVNRGLYVDQAAALRQLASGQRVIFVTGYDKIEQIFDRKYYEAPEQAWNELFQLAGFLVAQRGDAGFSVLSSLMRRPDIRRFGRYVAPIKLGQNVDKYLSSSAIRAGQTAGASGVKALPPESLAFLRYWQPYVAGGRYGLRLQMFKAFKQHPDLAENSPGLRALVSGLEDDSRLQESLQATESSREALLKVINRSESDDSEGTNGPAE